MLKMDHVSAVNTTIKSTTASATTLPNHFLVIAAFHSIIKVVVSNAHQDWSLSLVFVRTLKLLDVSRKTHMGVLYVQKITIS